MGMSLGFNIIINYYYYCDITLCEQTSTMTFQTKVRFTLRAGMRFSKDISDNNN